MAGQKISKSIPKRASNAGLKARRATSWQRSRDRKEARRRAQAERERANVARRANGEPTPHARWKRSRPRGQRATPGPATTERRWTLERAVARMRAFDRRRRQE